MPLFQAAWTTALTLKASLVFPTKGNIFGKSVRNLIWAFCKSQTFNVGATGLNCKSIISNVSFSHHQWVWAQVLHVNLKVIQGFSNG